jgi:hypothetical protein
VCCSGHLATPLQAQYSKRVVCSCSCQHHWWSRTPVTRQHASLSVQLWRYSIGSRENAAFSIVCEECGKYQQAACFGCRMAADVCLCMGPVTNIADSADSVRLRPRPILLGSEVYSAQADTWPKLGDQRLVTRYRSSTLMVTYPRPSSIPQPLSEDVERHDSMESDYTISLHVVRRVWCLCDQNSSQILVARTLTKATIGSQNKAASPIKP